MDAYELGLKELKKDQRPLRQLEEKMKVPAETLRDIQQGITDDPRWSTVRKIKRFYAVERRRRSKVAVVATA